MNKCDRLAQQAISALDHESELPASYLDQLRALPPLEKRTVALAIRNYHIRQQEVDTAFHSLMDGAA